jgi:sugar transferase (PEP-CTERM/EpsH1 system associated)
VARAGLSELCREVAVFTRRRPAALLNVALAASGGGSLTMGWHKDGRVEEALDDLGARHDYDLCWAFSSGTGPWMERARARHRILDLCDVDALKWRALARDEAPPRRWVYGLEARRLLPREVALAERADACLVSTDQEADDLRERGTPRRLQVLTNGVPWQDFAGLPPASAAQPVVGFLGQMDYPPNVRAVVHLAREVLPRVRQRVPGARLRILGRAPAAAVTALARPGEVEVTGEVASVPQALGGLAAFCAPLDQGRGIPNKILEALAAARPVVVSSWAARALAGEPGRDYLVADGAEARAEALGPLLAEPSRRDALGRAGRAYVQAHHDWESVLDRLETIVREVTGA